MDRRPDEVAPGGTAAGRPRKPVRVDRRLARESTAARPHFVLAALLGAVTAGLTVAQAALLAHAITVVAMGHASLAAVSSTLIALGAVLAARAVMSGLFELSGRIAAARVLAELRSRVARQLLIIRPGRGARERTGELATAAVQGVDSLEDYFAGYLPAMMLATFVPIAVMVWVVPLDPIVAGIFAITVPLLITFMILIGVGAQSRTRQRWHALTLLSSHFVDVLSGLETLRAHRREQAQAEVLATVGERYRAETMATLRLAFVSALALELCAMIGTGLCAATIGVQLTGGHLGLEAGLTVLLLAPELYGPLRSVGQQFHASADGLAAAGRLLELLDEPALLTTGDPASSCPTPDPGASPIRFEHVSFRYGDRREDALHDVSLTLMPHEFVAVCGASGAGKSTLAALALRLADPTGGRVSCGGRDLRTVEPGSWRQRCAWVPQHAHIFSGTLAENVALYLPQASPEQISDAVRAAGLADLVDSLPYGVETKIGDGGRRLSGGESQRVAVARAFLAEAGLVVLDEPTANLDDDTAGQIGASISALARERTVLLITHDLSLADRADRVLEFDSGRLLAVPSESMDSPLAVAR